MNNETAKQEETQTIGEATYSPDDNKIRIYPRARLDAETYARVKAAGFKWAPKQEVFVAPMWTPARADLAAQLCGSLGDEDTTLTERAEIRAERFEEYSEKRERDGDAARAAVRRLADGIPFGQPILVGHHSERRARKDAERIHNGMRKAVHMWETSQYWEQRAAGALAHAKYKELPAVRARRIKKIEADKRKMERTQAEADGFARLWSRLDDPSSITKAGEPVTVQERAAFIANRDHVSRCFPLADYPRELPASQYEGSMSLWSALDGGVITPGQAQEIALRVHARMTAHAARWLDHYNNRLTYERAMLAEQGGTVADQTTPEVGGAVKSVWAVRGGWAYIVKVNRVTVTLLHQYQEGGKVFRHNEPMDKIREIMTRAQVEQARAAGRLREAPDGVGFWLLDREPAPATEEPAEEPAPEPQETREDKAEQARATLAAGVQVVAVPQLFPTPRDLAARMADMADIQPGHRCLEPSAGTGVLLGAMGGRMFGADIEPGRIHAVEVSAPLCDRLRADFPLTVVHCGDFLSMSSGDFAGGFDRILMNPPFGNAQDIQHIKHAAGLLNPGGHLVALCANGPRQRAQLEPMADYWEDLPEGTFSAQGTGVNVALLVIEA